MARRRVLVMARFDVVRRRAEDWGRADGIRLAADEQAQFSHLIFQGFRLCIEFFRGAGAFLRAGGIALETLSI